MAAFGADRFLFSELVVVFYNKGGGDGVFSVDTMVGDSLWGSSTSASST